MDRRNLITGLTSLACATTLSGCGGNSYPTTGETDHGGTTPPKTYSWKRARFGGGGAIPGLVIHPRVSHLAYLTADVGGCDRWDGATQTWTPLFHWASSDSMLYGCEAVAIDPSDISGNIIYASVGKYSYPGPVKGQVLKSVDRGVSWTQTSHRVSVASNWDQIYPKRLVVDPLNGNVIYHASREGLYRSVDGAANWTLLTAAPTGDLSGLTGDSGTDSGLAFVAVVPNDGAVTTAGVIRSKSVFVFALGMGLHSSDDGGETWSPVAGSPPFLNNVVSAPDGTLYVAGPSGVFSLKAGVWSDISPISGLEYHALDVDPFDPRRIIVAEHAWSGHNKIWLSTTAGASGGWTEITGNNTLTFDPAWYPTYDAQVSIFSLAFDPHQRNRVWFTDYWMPWRTDDIGASAVAWKSLVKGHEELVAIGGLLSPPSGNIKLYAGVADMGGFALSDLTAFPTKNVWGLGITEGLNLTGIAIQESDPSLVAAVSANGWDGEGQLSISMNGGANFSNLPPPFSGAHAGRVAIGARAMAGEPNPRIVWATGGWSDLYVSKDLGMSWDKVQGASPPTGVGGDNIFNWNQALAADKTDPSRFYVCDSGNLYRSTDGGSNWSIASSGLPIDDLTTLHTVPGFTRTLWVSFGEKGLYKSSTDGASFTKIAQVQSARLFSFGKAAPNSSVPAVYVFGKISGLEGIFRSNDLGDSWTKIADTTVAGNDPNQLVADRQVYGTIYVGTNGNGICFGELV